MKKILVISSVVLVVLVVLGAAGFAYAQTQAPPTSPGTQPGMWGMMQRLGAGRMMGRMNPGMGAQMGRMMNGWFQDPANPPSGYGPMHPFMQAALADALGMTVDELQAKVTAGETPYDVAKSQGLSDEEMAALFQQAHAAALEKAVAAGVITQEQANAMQARMAQGPHMFGGKGMYGGAMHSGAMMRGGGMHGQRGMAGGRLGGYLHEYKVNALAEALGLSVEELNARLVAGERPAEIAQAQGLTLEAFREQMLAASKSAIAQAATDGKITQEQADWMLDRIEQKSELGWGDGHCEGWDTPQP